MNPLRDLISLPAYIIACFHCRGKRLSSLSYRHLSLLNTVTFPCSDNIRKPHNTRQILSVVHLKNDVDYCIGYPRSLCFLVLLKLPKKCHLRS